MLRSLKIENFRRFDRFELRGLGRVNLLVGLNNSGKTSILEAVHLLTARYDVASVYAAALRRGERLFENGERGPSTDLDVCRLFHGYDLSFKNVFRIDGSDEKSKEWVEGKVDERSEGQQVQLFTEYEVEHFDSALSLNLRWSGQESPMLKLALSSRGGLSLAETRQRMRARAADERSRPVRFIESSSLSAGEVVSLFDEVVLTPDEGVVVDALRIIDPAIERIASVTSYSRFRSSELRGGIVVRCAGHDSRIPIGTMGDGIWRLLGLALALVRSEGGILLVDEIDAGLHYTAMSDMWRLVYETAVRTNTQVFATTHNSDCWTSLASVIRKREEPMDVSIQRIEPERAKAVAFSPKEIVIAAERDIEVR